MTNYLLGTCVLLGETPPPTEHLHKTTHKKVTRLSWFTWLASAGLMLDALIAINDDNKKDKPFSHRGVGLFASSLIILASPLFSTTVEESDDEEDTINTKGP